MNLYGLAIAAIPKKNDPDTFRLICTPVSVCDQNREAFCIHTDLGYKTEFRLSRPQEMMDYFVHTVDCLEHLVKLQEKETADAGMHYRPVSVMMGEDSRNPVDFNMLSVPLFGEVYHTPGDVAVFKKIYGKDVVRDANITNKEDIHDYFEYMQFTERALGNDNFEYAKTPQYIAYQNALALRDGTAEQHAKNAAQYNKDALLANKPFTEACAKLSRLMKRCTLKHGSYSPANAKTIIDLEQTDFDREIIRLKADFLKGDDVAFLELAAMAYAEGVAWAAEVNDTPSAFSYPAPSGYEHSPAAQEECPSYIFFQWDPAFRKAFYEGYYDHINTPNYRHLKLPMDVKNPPFADPTADMVCEQFQVLKSARTEDKVTDLPDWREKIGRSAQKICDLSDQTPLSSCIASQANASWASRKNSGRGDSGVPLH